MTRSVRVLETIKSIILDFQETRFETGVPRRLRIETARGKAAVCIGVRRCGKSTYLFQLIERLVQGGVPRENILYLNLFVSNGVRVRGNSFYLPLLSLDTGH
jgi:hypothetical protein